MERNSKLLWFSTKCCRRPLHQFEFSTLSVHIRIHLPELHEETHSHKEVIIHDDHGHGGHGGGGHGGHGGDGGGFAEGLIGGFLSSGGGHGGGGNHGGHGNHGSHGGHGGGNHGHGGGFGGHASGGHSHGGHGNDDLLIATIGNVLFNRKIHSFSCTSNTLF